MSSKVRYSLQLQHMKIECVFEECIAILIDDKGFEILKGYGSNMIEAINDLHQNLI